MATTNKRARELARAKEERRRAREIAERAKRRKRRQMIAIGAVLALIAAAVAAWLLTRPDDAVETPPTALASTEAASAITTGEQPVAACSAPGELQAAPLSFESPGDAGLGEAATANFTFSTNCGDVVVQANNAAAPLTVNGMAYLANEDYFDGTLCHRLTTESIFVLQCGDPTATGTGSPGFTLPDENLPTQVTNNYPAGTVAMANSGPGTSGSQFFIVYQDTTLPASYTNWGTVTSGLEAVSQIAAAGTTDGSTDGAPKQAVMIQDVAVQAQ